MDTDRFSPLPTLFNRIRDIAPVDGISFGQRDDKSTWRIDFKPEATAQQRRDVQAVVDAFDVAVEEQKLKDKEKAKTTKKVGLLLDSNKAVTVQDLIDLGML